MYSSFRSYKSFVTKKKFKERYSDKVNTIIFLVRSHNRPEYLLETLRSTLLADIDLCTKRYIYDDGSKDTDTLYLLSNPSYINVKGKEFKVILNESNRGCRSR